VKIEIIQAPSRSFMQMLMGNIKAAERDEIQLGKWGAVGLIQAPLIELYHGADLAGKASDVKTALVSGSCPQHIQMLAILGNPASVKAAVEKIQSYYGR